MHLLIIEEKIIVQQFFINAHKRQTIMMVDDNRMTIWYDHMIPFTYSLISPGHLLPAVFIWDIIRDIIFSVIHKLESIIQSYYICISDSQIYYIEFIKY